MPPSSSSTSVSTTRAPSATKSRASASPCPRAPPVISATLPSSRPIDGTLRLRRSGAQGCAPPPGRHRGRGPGHRGPPRHDALGDGGERRQQLLALLALLGRLVPAALNG